MGNPFGGDNSSLDNSNQNMQNGDQAQGSHSTGYNPNFQPLLNDLPQDLHGKVLPHLQQWDKGVNERFQKLQSDYEPWKPILNQPGVTPDMVSTGLGMLNLLETNPEALYKALVENYKFGQNQDSQAGQGQTPPVQPTPTDDPLDPRFQQLENNFATLAQHVLEMKRQEDEARADQAIAAEFAAAHKKLGDFNDKWVQAHCIADPSLSVEKAASMYQEWHRAEMAKHGARPLITGSSSGGVPGQAPTDVTKLSPKDTRTLFADMLRQAKASNSQ